MRREIREVADDGVRVRLVYPAVHATVMTAGLAQAAAPSAESGDSGRRPVGRVVLVDPREERRAIMSLLVELSPALTIVGLAADLDQAETQIRAEHANIAVVEIQMPVDQGLATVAALRRLFPDLCIVVCSFHLTLATQDAARRHGADGYLAKPLDLRELVRLVQNPSRPSADADPTSIDPALAVAASTS